MSSSKQHIKLFPKQWHKESIMERRRRSEKKFKPRILLNVKREEIAKKDRRVEWVCVCVHVFSFLSYPKDM